MPIGMGPPAPKSGNEGLGPPTGMVTPTKEMDPPTTSNGGTEPREEVSSLSTALLIAGAQCGCGGLVALTIVRKVTIRVRNGENEGPACADRCWEPQRHPVPLACHHQPWLGRGGQFLPILWKSFLSSCVNAQRNCRLAGVRAQRHPGMSWWASPQLGP